MENKTVESAAPQHIDTVSEGNASEIERRLQEIEKRQNETAKQSKWPLRIAIISLSASLLSIALTYRYQSKQADFQEDQALAQMTMNFNNSWNTTFDNKNRLKLERFRAKVKEWGNNPEARDNTLALLIDKDKVNRAELLRKDDGMMDLILLELKAKDKAQATSKDDHEIVEAAFQYRNTIINCLNTMESIYTIKSYSKSQKTVDIINAQHAQIINIWVHDLMPFLSKYREIYPEKPQAWNILTNYEQRVD